MVSRNSLYRLRKYGLLKLVKSYDLVIPLGCTILIYTFFRQSIDILEKITFTQLSTNLSGGLIAVVLTGIAIVVSFSDRGFMNFIKGTDVYDNLLFIFEYAVVLSVFTTVLGIIVQTFGLYQLLFFIFLFVFFHLIFAILRLISVIITFGDKKAEYSAIDDLDGEKLRENADIPDRLLQDEYIEEHTLNERDEN